MSSSLISAVWRQMAFFCCWYNPTENLKIQLKLLLSSKKQFQSVFSSHPTEAGRYIKAAMRTQIFHQVHRLHNANTDTMNTETAPNQISRNVTFTDDKTSINCTVTHWSYNIKWLATTNKFNLKRLVCANTALGKSLSLTLTKIFIICNDVSEEYLIHSCHVHIHTQLIFLVDFCMNC